MEYITEILIAVLSLAGSILGSYSGFRLTAYRVEQLEKKVDKHNHFAARMPLLEEQLRAAREHLQQLAKRMEALEERTHISSRIP